MGVPLNPFGHHWALWYWGVLTFIIRRGCSQFGTHLCWETPVSKKNFSSDDTDTSDDAGTSNEVPSYDNAATSNEVPCSDDAGTSNDAAISNEVPSSDDAGTSNEVLSSDDAATPNEVPSSDDAGTSNELPSSNDAGSSNEEAIFAHFFEKVWKLEKGFVFFERFFAHCDLDVDFSRLEVSDE